MANSQSSVNRTMNRRTLLGVLGASAAAPLLAEPRVCQAVTPYPKRLVILYTQEGLIPDLMIPRIAPGPLTQLTPTLSPLEPFRSRINIVGGLALLSCINQPWEGKPWADAHSGTVHLLTGAVSEGPAKHPTQGFTIASGAGGPSVDQFIASHFAKETPYPSLLYGMHRGSSINGPAGYLAFAGKGSPGIAPEADAEAAFRRLFGTSNEESARLAKEQRSILDYSRARTLKAQARLGQVNRQKLDHHLTAIRELEMRLQHKVACASPSWQSVVQASVAHETPTTEGIARLIEISKLALACDLTRVLSIQIGGSPGDNMNMDHVLLDGKPIDHNEHEVSHTGSIQQRPEKQAACTKWKASVYADLLGALDSVKEGDGTLLDHTLVLWVSQMATPWDHAMAPLTTVMAGSCGGAIKTGQFLSYGEPLKLVTRANDSRRVEDSAYTPHNRLLVSICHAMGLSHINSFGTEKYNEGGRLENLHV